MGLLDILNGMQNGPRGPSEPSDSSQSSGGMSPMTMEILALLAYKAVKHLGGSHSSGTAPTPSAPPQQLPGTSTASADGGGLGGLLSGGLGDLMKGPLGGTLGGLLAGGAAGGPPSEPVGTVQGAVGLPHPLLRVEVAGAVRGGLLDQWCGDQRAHDRGVCVRSGDDSSLLVVFGSAFGGLPGAGGQGVLEPGRFAVGGLDLFA